MLNNCALVLLVPTASLGSHSDFVGESIQDILFNYAISLIFYGIKKLAFKINKIIRLASFMI